LVESGYLNQTQAWILDVQYDIDSERDDQRETKHMEPTAHLAAGHTIAREQRRGQRERAEPGPSQLTARGTPSQASASRTATGFTKRCLSFQTGECHSASCSSPSRSCATNSAA